jgi:hypothetical protein
VVLRALELAVRSRNATDINIKYLREVTGGKDAYKLFL